VKDGSLTGTIISVKLSGQNDEDLQMVVGILTLHLHLPSCTSLKEKRSRIKPIISRLHREYNVSAAEVDLQDRWNEALLACSVISTDGAQVQRVLQNVIEFAVQHFHDVDFLDNKIELIPGV
jgi:uncharacterized protein YlxP (DUF503 family)